MLALLYPRTDTWTSPNDLLSMCFHVPIRACLLVVWLSLAVPLFLATYPAKVIQSLEHSSYDSSAPHTHFFPPISAALPNEMSAPSRNGSSSKDSSASSASLASIINIENKYVISGSQNKQLSMHPSMSPSPSGSVSISLASLPQQYAGSSSSSISGQPLPPPAEFTPLPPYPASTMSSKDPQQYGQRALPQSIYFSSSTSEPGTYHHIRRAPEATRHPGGSGERFCLPKPRIYRVVYPYKPQQMDEIELAYGDLLTVTIQCDDGWFLGRSTLSGKFGTFPGNYVEIV